MSDDTSDSNGDDGDEEESISDIWDDIDADSFAGDYTGGVAPDSYLSGETRECPDHGHVLPVALPYVVKRNSDADGYHLVCPRCRYFFEEYSPTAQQWEDR